MSNQESQKPLTDWIINAAMEQLAEWRSKNTILPVAINLSAWNLQDPQLVNSIRERLSAWKLPSSYVEFEVTESAMMADPVRAAETMTQLDKMGINLALDDFGTGFSSLSHLKKMPFDVLKIDRSFVSGMVSDKNDASIVQSTIELAHNLGMRVVAEGVEDKQTLDELASLGCDITQGYYFSCPLAADALLHWMEQSPWGFLAAGGERELVTTFHSTKSVH